MKFINHLNSITYS